MPSLRPLLGPGGRSEDDMTCQGEGRRGGEWTRERCGLVCCGVGGTLAVEPVSAQRATSQCLDRILRAVGFAVDQSSRPSDDRESGHRRQDRVGGAGCGTLK